MIEKSKNMLHSLLFSKMTKLVYTFPMSFSYIIRPAHTCLHPTINFYMFNYLLKSVHRAGQISELNSRYEISRLKQDQEKTKFALSQSCKIKVTCFWVKLKLFFRYAGVNIKVAIVFKDSDFC